MHENRYVLHCMNTDRVMHISQTPERLHLLKLHRCPIWALP